MALKLKNMILCKHQDVLMGVTFPEGQGHVEKTIQQSDYDGRVRVIISNVDTLF